jgi:hypothetical protein
MSLKNVTESEDGDSNVTVKNTAVVNTIKDLGIRILNYMYMLNREEHTMIFEYDELKEYVTEDFEQFYNMGFNCQRKIMLL